MNTPRRRPKRTELALEKGSEGSEEEVSKGRRCIEEMEDILRAANRRKR